MKRLLGIGILASLIAAVGAFGAPVGASAASATTCTGPLAPGTYGTVTVPDGAVCVSDGPVNIKGGLYVGAGATFVLGSEESPGSTGTINGGVHATNAANVQIHFATINGGVDIQGGSGPFVGPFGVTWDTIEDSTIHGGVTINGYNGFWLGFIRNTISGSVNLTNNTVLDPDANEFVTNTIKGNMNCSGNAPAAHVGDSGGSPNNVTGQKTGECTAV